MAYAYLNWRFYLKLLPLLSQNPAFTSMYTWDRLEIRRLLHEQNTAHFTSSNTDLNQWPREELYYHRL